MYFNCTVILAHPVEIVEVYNFTKMYYNVCTKNVHVRESKDYHFAPFCSQIILFLERSFYVQ